MAKKTKTFNDPKPPKGSLVDLNYDTRLIDLGVNSYTKSELVKQANGDPDRLHRLIDVINLSGVQFRQPIGGAAPSLDEYIESKTKGLSPTEKEDATSILEKEYDGSGLYSKWVKQENKRSKYILGNVFGTSYVAEEAHGYRDKQEGSRLKDFLTATPLFFKKAQAKDYDDPDHFEYDTHKNVQPILQKYIDGEIPYEDIQKRIDFNRERNKDGLYDPSPGRESIGLPQPEDGAKTYVVGGTKYKIPNEKVEAFVSQHPAAQERVSFVVGTNVYNIPPDRVDAFLRDMPNATRR